MTGAKERASLLLTSGEGPRECRHALGLLADRIARDAGHAKLDARADPAGADTDTLRSCVLTLEGRGAKAFAAGWVGTVQWICRSPFRPHHKRRNWFVGVFELEDRALPDLDARSSDLRIETFRAGGPGGQHQNTTDSAVRVTHLPTGTTVVSREERSQHRNRARAIERMRVRLYLAAEEGRAWDRHDRHVAHRALERGNPAHVFEGERFVRR